MGHKGIKYTQSHILCTSGGLYPLPPRLGVRALNNERPSQDVSGILPAFYGRRTGDWDRGLRA